MLWRKASLFKMSLGALGYTLEALSENHSPRPSGGHSLSRKMKKEKGKLLDFFVCLFFVFGR